MPDPKIFQLMKKFRKALLAQDEAALQQVLNAYRLAYEHLQGRLDALLLAIEKVDRLTPTQFVRLAQYDALALQLETELSRFGVVLETQVSAAARAALYRGDADSWALLKTMWGAHGFIRANFARMPYESITTMISFLQPKSPLYKAIGKLARSRTDEVLQGLLDGIITGASPRVTASRLKSAFTAGMGRGLSDALRITRTAQLYSYRAATLANYQANSDVVTGWYWLANVGGNPEPCLSCLAQHGSRHELDETLDDHDNGRCSMLPEVAGQNPMLGMPTGEQYFSNLSESTQRELMGKGRYQAWQEGQFQFGQLTQLQEHSTWGHVHSTTPLKDLLKGEAEA